MPLVRSQDGGNGLMGAAYLQRQKKKQKSRATEKKAKNYSSDVKSNKLLRQNKTKLCATYGLTIYLNSGNNYFIFTTLLLIF